jgi:hypothetical protein
MISANHRFQPLNQYRRRRHRGNKLALIFLQTKTNVLARRTCLNFSIKENWMKEETPQLYDQGCQIFIDAIYPNWENIYQVTANYSKWPQNIPNGRKTDRIVIKYTNTFHCKNLPNLPKLEFLV